MNHEDYWKDIDQHLIDLVENGFVKLPSLSQFTLNDISKNISDEMIGNTFSELSLTHSIFLKNLAVEKYLTPRLFNLAKDIFSYKGSISNQYHIARRVNPGNSKEMYRAHFDSHLFTMVLPIKIPKPLSKGTAGELIYFPKARKSPKNEIHNFIGKASYKRFSSKEGIEKFSKIKKQRVDNFEDYRPLLFFGNTTLHTNKQVSADCSSYRLTLLAHFFDPSPKYGVGEILRLIRSR